MFSRATFIPASISPRMTSGESVAGPSVQTILVFLMVSTPFYPCFLCLLLRSHPMSTDTASIPAIPASHPQGTPDSSAGISV